VTQHKIEVLLAGSSFNCDQGNIAFCGIYLIEAVTAERRKQRILFDFGHFGRRRHLLRALDERGLSSDDIDTVVLSHGHWDHVQNADLFPRSRLVAHRAELEYMQAPHPNDHATPPWAMAIIDRLKIRAVEDGETLVPGISAMHLPGHSRGSLGLVVETEQGLAVITGDAIASAHTAQTGRCMSVFWDVDLADTSIRRVTQLADCIYPGHDRPFRQATGGSAEYLVPALPIGLSSRDLSSAMFQFSETQERERIVMPGIGEWPVEPANR
jgi:N-acyl homoserine lactone hydrolase